MFDEITTETSFTRIEEQIRRLWRLHDIPAAFAAVSQNAPSCQLVQQPLAVAGQSWTDQVRLLATGDLLARYLTMRGFAVRRKLGWECHGLRIEVHVEQTLEAELARYDMAQFNAACYDVALEGRRQAEALADRLGIWFGSEGTYATMDPQAVGAVWGSLHQLWQARRLKRERRMVSICPRCATPLSAAEGMRLAPEVESRSIWVRLPWDDEPDAYFLIWTPVAWTLAGMVALAVHPKAAYVLVEVTGRQEGAPIRLVLAEAALSHTLADDYRLIRRLGARQLRRARYRPLFTFLPAGQDMARIVVSDQVPLEQGTGLLPVIPAFDARSLALARAHELPIPDLLDNAGGLTDAVTPWRGLMPSDAEPLLVDDLRVRGLLFQEQIEIRSCPVCPYCGTALLPQVRDVWLVETGSEPWIVGRDRAWGAPLPVWECNGCGEQLCLAGLDELAFRAGLEGGPLDPHRPAVDRLTFPCAACGGTMRRVGMVVDAAFEAAVLPWAAAFYGDRAGQRRGGEAGDSRPQNLAVGLGDRDLGWLGDVTEVTALLRGSLAWEQAVALPESSPGSGWDVALTPPADVLRWAAYSGKTPDQAEHDFLRPLWRVMMAPAAKGRRLPAGRRQEEQAVLNRWLLARLKQTIGMVTQALDACDPDRAADALSGLIHDLVAWYVPPWPEGEDRLLETLSRLLAPFVPHLADALYRSNKERAVESVHLLTWPVGYPSAADRALLASTALVWRLVALGKIARDQAGIEPDRHLARAIVIFRAEAAAEPEELIPVKSLLGHLLHVSQIDFADDVPPTRVWHLSLDPDQAGDRVVPAADIDAALGDLSAKETARLLFQLWAGQSVSLKVGGQLVTLLPDEVRVLVHPGWAAAAMGGRILLLKVD